MDKIVITAASSVTEAHVRGARLGTRFGRMDLASQLAVAAVEALQINFDAYPREKIGICLAAAAGSLSTDVEFWRGRDGTGGPSPILFTYTLPNVAIGEIAIRHRLTGPNLCLVGNENILIEAADMLQRGEAEACLCISCHSISLPLTEIIQRPAAARACALFLQRGAAGLCDLDENSMDIESICALSCARKTAS